MGPAAARIKQAFEAAAQEARDEVLKALSSDRYGRLVRALGSLPDSPLPGDKAGRPARKGLAKLVKKDVRRLRRKAAALEQPTSEDADSGAGLDAESGPPQATKRRDTRTGRKCAFMRGLLPAR